MAYRKRLTANKFLADEVQTATLVIGGDPLGGTTGYTMSGTELAYLDGVTPGTVTASKGCVVDANTNLGVFAQLGVVDLVDEDDNEVLTLTGASSATNEFTITNALGSASPSIACTGSSASNITGVLKGKGTGGFNIQSGFADVAVATAGSSTASKVAFLGNTATSQMASITAATTSNATASSTVVNALAATINELRAVVYTFGLTST